MLQTHRPEPSAHAAPALSALNLHYRYEGVEALRGVSLELHRGRVTAIAGANGSGKSTLIELLAGTRRPHSGTVSRQGTLALVVQRPAAPDTLPVTVHDVIAMGTWRSDSSRRFPGRLTRQKRAAIQTAVERVGLGGLEKRLLRELSGGQRQRAFLAQGLVQDAEILLLDEPAANLDADSRLRTRHILAEEAAQGRAVACVSHDPETIEAADMLIRLDQGRRVA